MLRQRREQPRKGGQSALSASSTVPLATPSAAAAEAGPSIRPALLPPSATPAPEPMPAPTPTPIVSQASLAAPALPSAMSVSVPDMQPQPVLQPQPAQPDRPRATLRCEQAQLPLRSQLPVRLSVTNSISAKKRKRNVNNRWDDSVAKAMRLAAGDERVRNLQHNTGIFVHVSVFMLA